MVALGTWFFPSGNDCEASVETDEHGVMHLWLRWEKPPPLLEADHEHYYRVMLPELIRELVRVRAVQSKGQFTKGYA